MNRLRFKLIILALIAFATANSQTFTQRLNPVISADVNDICPNDEVELTLTYDDPLNTSLLLNGLDELANISPSPAHDFGATTDFTVEVWVKTTSLGAQSILSKAAVGLPGFTVGMNAGVVVVGITDGVNPPVVANGFTPIADGNWHHLAIVFDRDDKVTIYTDGFFDNDGNITTVGDINNVDLMRIGAFNDGVNLVQHFNGYIDEVRIWNSALAVAQINARSTTHINPNSVADLVGYWDMNDNTAPTLIDCSASGAGAIMVGSASLSADAPVFTFPFLPIWSNAQTGTLQFVSPTDTTKYSATVGYCKYSSIDSITVNVLECEDVDNSGIITSVWVPNAFTPNGDTKNDVFEVKGSFITFYEIKIFNRFGNILYHSRNILNPWDGTFEGKRVKDDVYTYIIRYRDVEGNEFTKHGTVAILQ